MFKSVIKPINNAAQGNIIHSLACVQCVQYHRKARWVPKAKSKIFRVPERKKQDEDEKLELLTLHNRYKSVFFSVNITSLVNIKFFSRTQVRAVRSYLLEETRLKKATTSVDHIVVTPEEEAAEMLRCIELNDAWNANIAEIRNKRLQMQRKEREEYILSRLELKEQREDEALRAADELVRLEKVCFPFKTTIHNYTNARFLILRNVRKRSFGRKT